MAIDPTTKQLLYYEDKADQSKGSIYLDKLLLADNTSISLHNDKQVYSSNLSLNFFCYFRLFINLLLISFNLLYSWYKIVLSKWCFFFQKYFLWTVTYYCESGHGTLECSLVMFIFPWITWRSCRVLNTISPNIGSNICAGLLYWYLRSRGPQSIHR